ncbi:MAG: hypothetical protein MUD07_03245 [Burkholderiaceae bacterium]|nr:hypothetical protein [Burkholderiaceae bacterium]
MFFGSSLIDIEVQAVIEQSQFDVLGRVGVKVQVDVGVFGSDAAQHRSDQVRVELCQLLHHARGHAAQCGEQLRVGRRRVQLQMTPDLTLDLGIVRQLRPRDRRFAQQV